VPGVPAGHGRLVGELRAGGAAHLRRQHLPGPGALRLHLPRDDRGAGAAAADGADREARRGGHARGRVATRSTTRWPGSWPSPH
jgi:hypothetical protein